MNTAQYKAKCRLDKIGSVQEAAEITYSAAYETEKTSIIEVTRSNARSRSTERFKCQKNISDCIELIMVYTENCVDPIHCRDVASDLGYCVAE